MPVNMNQFKIHKDKQVASRCVLTFEPVLCIDEESVWSVADSIA